VRGWHRWPSALLAIVLVASCAGPPPEPEERPVARAPTSDALAPAALALAQRQRHDLGMRADPEWVMAVAKDPRAEEMLGLLMLPGERAAMRIRLGDGRRIVPRVMDYATKHPGTWAGASVDMERGGVIVVRVSDGLELHTAALRGLIGDEAVVEVELVDWSEAELRRMEQGVDTTWLDKLPASFRLFGVDLEANRIRLEVSSPDPDAAAKILAHYGDPPWLVVRSELEPTAHSRAQ